MTATKTQAKPSTNGAGAGGPGAKAREAGEAVTSAARRARGPMLAIGVGAAGLAGGLTIGSRLGSKRSGVAGLLSPQRRVLGVPVGRKSVALKTAEALMDGAKHLSSATSRMSDTTDEVRRVREELESANRRSPLEVVLDGLTHRRGAHRREG